MVYSEQALGLVAYKVQSAKGSQASGAGAEVLRVAGGSGGQYQRTAIPNPEVRQDAQASRGRLGSKTTQGAHDTVMSLGNVDTIFEALFRSTWGSADTVIDDETAAMSSATISVASNVITASTGSWITAGFRVGDIIRESEGLLAASQDRNLRITALTATAMTVAPVDGVDLGDEAGPISAYTFTRPGRVLINAAAGAITKRYFTIEEYDINIDGSEVYTDCVWSGANITMAPDAMVMINPSWMGTGQFETLTGGSSPLFTSPSETTALAMEASQATIRIGSSTNIDLTGLEITIDTTPVAPPTINKDGIAADVFQGSFRVSMNITMLRQDLLDVADLIAETEQSLSIIINEPDSAPEDFFSIFVPNFVFGTVDKSALSIEGGPRTQTINIPADLVGKDETGGAYDATTMKIQVSNS
jgi:hypothetical protein